MNVRIILKFKEGKWELRVVEPTTGGLGVILLGPRGRVYYLPPMPSAGSKYPVPKYLLQKVKGLKQFPEVTEK